MFPWGIFRLPDLEIATIETAARAASRFFDEKGADGVAARHFYAMENHLFAHRIAAIAGCIAEVASGKSVPVFGGNARMPMGIHLAEG